MKLSDEGGCLTSDHIFRRRAPVAPARDDSGGRFGLGGTARRLIALLVLCLLLFGVLLGAISEGSAGHSTLRVGAASDALTVAITLAGVATLAAVVLSLYMMSVRNRGGRDLGRKRSSAFSRMMVFLAVALFLAFLRLIVSRHVRPHPLGAAPGAATKATHAASTAVSFRPDASFSTLGVVVLLAAVIALISWRGAVRRRHRVDFGFLERAPDVSVYDGAPSLAESLAEVGVPDPSEEADPRRAVVAAYLAMLHAAGEAGCLRRPEVTPSEFLDSLLASLGVSPSSASRLTALFERARYSSLPVDESLRSSAIDALQQVRSEMTANAAQPA